MYRVVGIVVVGCIAGVIGWILGLQRRVQPVVLPLRSAVGRISETQFPLPMPTPLPQLSLSRIFLRDHTFVDMLDKEKTVTILTTGDVLLARTVNHLMVASDNYRWPFEKTADVLTSADMTIINLETPLVSGCVPTQTGMIFCGDPRGVDGLLFAGVDIAGLSNNHILNYGPKGVQETMQILAKAGILSVYTVPVFTKIKDMRFAFVAYNDVGNLLQADVITQEIANIRNDADIVVVLMHWGEEYTAIPTARQKALAHAVVDAGASFVIGNHPHWIQPVEMYRDALIVYAHGNFVFDQEWSEETKTGVIGKYVLFDGKLVDAEFIPIRIVEYGQPYILNDPFRETVLRAMSHASERIIDTSE